MEVMPEIIPLAYDLTIAVFTSLAMVLGIFGFVYAIALLLEFFTKKE